jgi:hypothetical protein
MVGTWQPAFGETNMMLGLEALEKLIDVLLVLPDFCKEHRLLIPDLASPRLLIPLFAPVLHGQEEITPFILEQS